MIEDKEIEKIKKIKEMIQTSIKTPDQETFYFSFELLEKEPLLKDRNGLEKILNIIQSKSNDKISWKIKEEYKFVKGDIRAGDLDPYSRTSATFYPAGIEIHVSDFNKIKEYFNIIFSNLDIKVKNIINKSYLREEIFLSNINIKINGRFISRGEIKKKKVFDPTEEELIYFLYNQHLNNSNNCFTIQNISKEVNKKEGSIRNRISNVNEEIRNIISVTKKVNILLIKNEKGRGYRLNPNVFKSIIKN